LLYCHIAEAEPTGAGVVAFLLKVVFVLSLLTWAVGGIWIMTSGGALTFDMIDARPVIIHHVAAFVTGALGLILLVRWIWMKLYS
jgi:hypothetical protein